MKTSRHIVCVVYDPLIEKHLGTKPAQAFDWLYSFLHLKEGSGTIRDGRKWVKFTYKQLEEVSNALPNAYAWRRALEKLEKWGLVISEESEKKDGKWYAIHFIAVWALIGKEEFSNGYELDMVNQKTAKWMNDYHWEKEQERKRAEQMALAEKLKESNERIKAEQDEQAELSKIDSPMPEQDEQAGLSKIHRGVEQDAQTSIYIESFDSSFDSKDDSSSANADGASAETSPIKEIILEKNELPAPTNVFQAVARIIYPSLVLDEEMRKTVQRVIYQIQNTQVYVGQGKREKPLLDPIIVEDYGIWRMLISDTGRSGFPSVQEFLDEFRFQFFKWYWTPSNRAPIEQIKAEFKEWRTRLFVGDYGEFRKDVQERNLTAKKTPQSAAQDWRTQPYGDSPAVKPTQEDLDEFRKRMRGFKDGTT